MQWCECPLGACYDANVPLVHAMMRMSAWEYSMMQMSHWCMLWCECPLWCMQWCKCAFVGMQWCKCTLVGMLWWKYPLERCAMMRMFRCKHNLFKNSLYFQNEAFSAPETKIFSKLDLLFLKSHLFFWLKAPKILVITVKNLRMEHWLGI